MVRESWAWAMVEMIRTFGQDCQLKQVWYENEVGSWELHGSWVWHGMAGRGKACHCIAWRENDVNTEWKTKRCASSKDGRGAETPNAQVPRVKSENGALVESLIG